MIMSLRLAALAALASQSLATYTLKDDYSASNFFDMFEFFTATDPTHGFVNYVDQVTAQTDGLVSTNGQGQITLGVDSTNDAPNGRNSVRLTSNAVYQHGLVILDLAHMPVGCGTWPAFWMVGPNWPAAGEIDIIEGVNLQSTNAMTLHTTSGCSITNNNNFTGSISTYNCNVDASGQPTNAGCSIDASNSNTYGAGLNSNGGGVYATEWTSSAISIYFFPAGSVPSDITSGNPVVSGWSEQNRLAQFQGGCDIDSYFQNQQIVFDMTFCGDWAGAVWSDSTCATQSSSCTAFVADNPSAFTNAYWQINSLKVYQDNGEAASSQTTTAAGPTGVLSGLPSVLTSLAPIPVTSNKVETTFMVSVTPTTTAASISALSAGIWGPESTSSLVVNAPGLLSPESSTAALVAASTTTHSTAAASVTPVTAGAWGPDSSSSAASEPESTAWVTATAYQTSTDYATVYATAATATTAATAEPYFSDGQAVAASWFGQGAGFPRDRRAEATHTTLVAQAKKSEKKAHSTETVEEHNHRVKHAKLDRKLHRHAPAA